jgi:hypothetical protein
MQGFAWLDRFAPLLHQPTVAEPLPAANCSAAIDGIGKGRIMLSSLSMRLAAAAVCAGALLPATPALAQRTCSQNDLAVVITGMSDKLKRINVDSQSRMQTRLRELAKLKGWTEAETEEKGLDLLEDDETRVQDETASHLLGMIDKLGAAGDAPPSCTQIDELKAAAAQLVEVTSAKAAHVSAKLDTEIKSMRTAAVAPPPAPVAPKAPATPVPPIATQVPTSTAQPPSPPVKPPAKPGWETQTTGVVRPNDAYIPPTPGTPAPAAEPVDLEFSPDDIRAAGRGLFGTVSAELAAVIEYMFKSYGRPTGYILGTEGGAALLAGLRYGDGTLVTKRDGERKIYWQGPSVGYDLGLTGSRTMILIYNLTDVDEMLQRFGGMDGSAYLVGGVGVTVLKRGPIILAPIRTGLGLRLGANLGYLRFTPRPRFSPF